MTEDEGTATDSAEPMTADPATEEQGIEELISDSLKEPETSPNQDQASAAAAPGTDEPKPQAEETPKPDPEPSKEAGAPKEVEAAKEDEPIYTPPISLDEMPKELRAAYEEMSKGYKAGYTKKTQALAEQRKQLGNLSQYEGKADQIEKALAFQAQVEQLRNDPNAMNALAARMRGGTPAGQPPGQPPSAPVVGPDPSEAIRKDLLARGYSPEDVQNFERLSDENANAKMKQYHEQYIQPMITQRQADNQNAEVAKQNAEVASLKAEVSVLESDTKKFPHFSRLRQATFDRWQNDPQGVQTLADAYNAVVSEVGLGEIQSEAIIQAAANLNRKKKAAQIESSGTGTGISPTPERETVEEMLADAIKEG